MSYFNKIVNVWSHKVKSGMPDINNFGHKLVLRQVLLEEGWDIRSANTLIDSLVEADDKDDYVHLSRGIYVKSGDEDKEDAQKYKKTDDGKFEPIEGEETPEEEPSQKLSGPEDFERPDTEERPSEEEPEKDGKKVDKKSPTEAPTEDGVDRSGFDKKDPKDKDAPNGPTQQEILEDLNKGSLDVLTEYQEEVQRNREKGIAGMGGPVASEGESKYCDANNTDLGKWAEENKEAIANKRKELAGQKRNAEEKRAAKALGLDPNSDEFLDYLAGRETWVEQQREKAKNDPDHVFHKKGKKGFKGIDEDYDAWMRVAYNGAITTKAHLEQSEMDTSKPHKVVQSTTELDEAVQAGLEDQVKNAKTPEDKAYAKRQLKNFKKFRGYHDTYAIGYDKNGRMTYVGISNKKDSQMRDPQNNTTPAQRLRMIRKTFGEKIAKKVAETIDNAVDNVSNAQASSVKKQTSMEISDEVVEACEGEKMKPYMSDLDSKAEDTRPGRFGDYLSKQKPPKDWSKMSTKEKLEVMKDFAKSKLVDENGESRLKEKEDGTYYKTDDGEWKKIKSLGQIGLPYEPFGKIAIKLGEFKVNDETVGIKQDEKDVVTKAHTEVVNSLFEADEPDGYHPDKNSDADNGENTQGYISGVLQSMHIDTYIDMDELDDDSMLIQMGINGVKPSMIRECIAEKSGYDGPDTSTPEGKKALKEHLRKRCRVTPGGEKVSIVDSEGNETELFKDEWRTAGTSQKVASHFGDGMRNCLQEKAAKK